MCRHKGVLFRTSGLAKTQRVFLLAISVEFSLGKGMLGNFDQTCQYSAIPVKKTQFFHHFRPENAKIWQVLFTNCQVRALSRVK